MADDLTPTAFCQTGCGRPRQPHFNSKYCLPCRTERRQQPQSTVTPEQGALIARWIGEVSRGEIAQRLGMSRAAVNRYTREHGLYGRSDAYRPEVVEAVLRAYEHGGKMAVRQLFPDVCVRSIVERYKQYHPRQIRWTGEQQIDAARMAGLVSVTAQARYFGRPNAYAGSIKSLWAKRFQCAPTDVNGLASHRAWWIAHPGVPAVLVKHSTAGTCQPKVLWLDLAACLRPEVAPEIRDAVEALAAFQAWLHNTTDTAVIRAMIHERETVYGDETDPARERGAETPG